MSTRTNGTGDAFLDRLKRWCSPRACVEEAGIASEVVAIAEDDSAPAASNRGHEDLQEGNCELVETDTASHTLGASSSLDSSSSMVSTRFSGRLKLRLDKVSGVDADHGSNARPDDGIVDEPASPEPKRRSLRTIERSAGRATAATATAVSNGSARCSPRRRGGGTREATAAAAAAANAALGQQKAQRPIKRAIHSEYLSVYVKDPSRRSLVDVLVATLGPVEDTTSIGIKYRDTISDLWRRGKLYVMDDGVEKRIPFVKEREHAGGQVLYRRWPNKVTCFLWLSGVKGTSRPPIVFFVYTDRATRRNVTSVKWNGRLSSAEAEAEFARSGQSAPSVVDPNPSRPSRRAPAAQAAATHASQSASGAVGKRSIQVQPADETPPKRRRVATSTRDTTNKDGKDAPSLSDNDKSGKKMPATNKQRAAVAATEPNLRVPTHPEDHVLRCDDGSSLVAAFQDRVATFQQTFGNLSSVDLGFVYEDIMEMLLKEGFVHASARVNGDTADSKMLFNRKAMTATMERRFFASRSWTTDNQLELRLAERLDASGSVVTPTICIYTEIGNRNEVLRITWNGVHLTNESEMLSCIRARPSNKNVRQAALGRTAI